MEKDLRTEKRREADGWAVHAPAPGPAVNVFVRHAEQGHLTGQGFPAIVLAALSAEQKW